jgi:radical SAM superfamily enzyme YgiQ (UPF0313 family)
MKFVHIPTERTWLMPVGLIPLANLTKKYEHDVEVIHYGIDPIDLKHEDVLFDMHWHDQCAVVIDKCKEVRGKKIIGGFTATYYADEIEEKYPVKVIRGYAENDLLKLLGHDVKIDINELEYTNFDILRNYEKYLWDHLLVFNPGRGCPVDCTYCGGNSRVQMMCGLNKPIWLNLDKAIYELKNSLKYGIETWLVSFDPKPNGSYYIKLFDKIDFDIKCKFDCWGLPTKKFINKFHETFRDSEITISPKISEKLRLKHKGMPFTDDELFKTIEHIEKKGIKYKIYFATNFPNDDITDLVDRIGKDNIMMGNIIPEPGSRLFENCNIKSFTSLYLYTKFC